jgi:hypothetical protein
VLKSLQAGVLLSALVCVCSAYAQALPYADADSPREAVGMFKMTMGLSARMHEDCTRRFPELQPQIEKDLVAWRRLDAREFEITELRFSEMAKMRSRFEEQFAAMVKQGYENKMVYPFRGVAPEIEAKVIRDYCKQFFRELATGVWRQRTPNMYRYLQ